jgi:hypothetical protein
LFHWIGSDIEADLRTRKLSAQDARAKYLAYLKDNLDSGLPVKRPRVPEKLACGHIEVTLDLPVVCFTEWALSESRPHSSRYGRMAFGFSKPWVIRRGGQPVAYFSQIQKGLYLKQILELYEFLRTFEAMPPCPQGMKASEISAALERARYVLHFAKPFAPPKVPIGRFAPPSKKVQIDVRLDEIVLRALEKEPEQRYQHAGEVKTDVENITTMRRRGGVAAFAVPAVVGSDAAGPPTDPVLQRVQGPAMGLLATAIVNWIVVLMFIPLALYLATGVSRHVLSPMWLALGAAASWLILLTTLITVGALKMKRLESYGWAIAASIIAILGGAIGLPFGIWALVVLAQPDVKVAFQRRREQRRHGTPGQQLPTPAAPSVQPVQPGTWLGHLSLWTAVGGLVLPVVLVLVICLVSSTLKRNVPDIYLLLCILLAIAMELIALGCGIVARRTAMGHAGLLTSILSLVLYGVSLPAVFVAVPGGDVHPAERFVETGAAEIPAVTTWKRFATSDPTISKDLLVVENDAWVANCTAPQTIPLFEVPDPGVENCTVTYRAQVRTEGLKGRAYLEMWCRLPGLGESFSRGLDHVATGSTDWSSYETPFFLKQGEKPDLIRLNLVVEGTGRVGIRNIEVQISQ